MRRSQSRVQCPTETCVNSDRTNIVVSVAYNAGEFAPLVLHFANEFGPPKTVEGYLQRVVHEQG